MIQLILSSMESTFSCNTSCIWGSQTRCPYFKRTQSCFMDIDAILKRCNATSMQIIAHFQHKNMEIWCSITNQHDSFGTIHIGIVICVISDPYLTGWPYIKFTQTHFQDTRSNTHRKQRRQQSQRIHPSKSRSYARSERLWLKWVHNLLSNWSDKAAAPRLPKH